MNQSAKERISIAADHAGYEAKERLEALLREWGYEPIDLGTDSPESVDYPEYARAVAEQVSQAQASRGVLVCGSGQGMAMAANRYPGIRAALCFTGEQAELARRHNDANILCLASRMTLPEELESILKVWLETPFEGGRHERRIRKIDHQEAGKEC